MGISGIFHGYLWNISWVSQVHLMCISGKSQGCFSHFHAYLMGISGISHGYLRHMSLVSQEYLLGIVGQSYILDIIGQLSTISMVIIGNYKDSYDTATTTVNKSMSFDLSATQSYSVLSQDYIIKKTQSTVDS